MPGAAGCRPDASAGSGNGASWLLTWFTDRRSVVRGLLLLLLLLSACGRPEPTAEELAQKAIAGIDTLTSVHFQLSIDGGPAFLDPQKTLNLRQAEGDLLRPDRAKTTARVAIGGFVATVNFINVGDRGFMTDPLTGRWVALPAALVYNPAVLFDGQRGVSGLIKQVEGLKKDGDEKVDVVDSYRLTGQLPNALLTVFTGGVLTGDRVKIDLLVAKEGGAVQRIRLSELAAAPGQKAPMVWTLTLSRHDQPVTIDSPQ